MAKRKKSIAKKVSSVAYRTELFKPGNAKSIGQFFIANIVAGLAVGIGAALTTILIKWVAKEWDKYTGLLPDTYRKELYSGTPAGGSSTK